MPARGRLIVDAQLAEADPAGETLEEAVALRQLTQRGGGAWGEQAEVAGILRNLVASAPVDDGIEPTPREPAQPRLVLAVGFGGVDNVIAAIEPMPHQRFDQRRRMLTVTVHEQHGAEPCVIKAG